MSDNRSDGQSAAVLRNLFESNRPLYTPMQIKDATLDELRLDERLWAAYERGWCDFVQSFISSQLLQTETSMTLPEMSAMMMRAEMTRREEMENAGRDFLAVPQTSATAHGPATVPQMSASARGPQTVPQTSASARGPQTVPQMSASARGPQTVPQMSASARGPQTVPSTMKLVSVPVRRSATVAPTSASALQPATMKLMSVPVRRSATVAPTSASARGPQTVPVMEDGRRGPDHGSPWPATASGYNLATADRTMATPWSTSCRAGRFDGSFSRPSGARAMPPPPPPQRRTVPVLPRTFAFSGAWNRAEQSAVSISITPPEQVDYVPTAAEFRVVHDDDM